MADPTRIHMGHTINTSQYQITRGTFTDSHYNSHYPSLSGGGLDGQDHMNIAHTGPNNTPMDEPIRPYGGD